MIALPAPLALARITTRPPPSSPPATMRRRGRSGAGRSARASRPGPTRLDGVYGVFASPLGADGRVYVVGREGTTVVPTHAAEPEVLARNRLDDVSSSSPSAVGPTLYLRGERRLYALEAEDG